MKKIIFSDRYGLTQAVLDGKKTMTRRIIKGNFECIKAYNANFEWHFIADTLDGESIEIKPTYQIGEKVAVAQRYEECWKIYQRWESYKDPSNWRTPDAILGDSVNETPGWKKKDERQSQIYALSHPHHRHQGRETPGHQHRGL